MSHYHSESKTVDHQVVPQPIADFHNPFTDMCVR